MNMVDNKEEIMKKYFIIIENSNYADEFDLEGFALIDDCTSEQEVIDKYLTNDYDGDPIEFPTEFCFGTNEETSYNTREEMMEDISISEISEGEYKAISKVLGTSFGLAAILGSLEID